MAAVTQEQIEFIREMIERQAHTPGERVRVDVVEVMDRFDLPWAKARQCVQGACHALGHRMAGPNSSLVVIGHAAAGGRRVEASLGAKAVQDAVIFWEKYGE